jgi:cytochrome c oxidase subunit IV
MNDDEDELYLCVWAICLLFVLAVLSTVVAFR